MKACLLSLLLGAFASGAWALDISQWDNLSDQTGGGNLLASPGFEEGDDSWTLSPRVTTLGSFGFNGNQGVRLKWQKTSQSPSGVSQKIKLQPDRVYTVSLRVRTHELKGADNSKLRVQLKSTTRDSSGRTFYNGKALYKGKTGEWRTEVMKFSTSGAQAELECELVVFFAQMSMGQVDLDDIEIKEDAPVWLTWITLPRRTWIDVNGETLEFASSPSGYDYPGIENADYRCLVELRHPALEEALAWDLPVKNRRFGFPTGKLPEGDAMLAFTLIDAANKVVLGKRQIPMSVRQRPDNLAVEVDAHGRTLLHGRPFLPVGIYTTRLDDVELAALKGTPFNTVLPYSSVGLRVGEDAPGVPAIRMALDRIDAQGLKLIFSVKSFYPRIRFSMTEWAGLTDRTQIIDTLTAGLKDHPALLAWYVADELPSTFAPQIENWRRRINRNDPGHPTLATYHRPNELGELGMGQDIVAVDPYPIDNEESRDMKRVWDYMKDARHFVQAGSGEAALYLVPQVFNKGVLDAKTRNNLAAYRKNYRGPTEHEVLSMSVLGAIMGAKGFLFYSLQDMLHRGPDPEEFARRWPEVCRVAGHVRELEPFILSTRPSPSLEIDVKQGKIEARLMTAEDGRQVLLVAAVGPGPAEAIIALPDGAPALTSTTGKTTVSEQRYHFKATDIACDILK